MNNRWVTAALALAIVADLASSSAAQAQGAADWQTAAGGMMAFDVASVKLSTGGSTSNVPMNAGAEYKPTGGYFRAENFPLRTYLEFAYKIWPNEGLEAKMLAHQPGWIGSDLYSIEARAAGNPTKDQMRLMVQSLLADRFHLAAHFENQEVPVFILTTVQAGKLGPKLVSHVDRAACPDLSAATSDAAPRIATACRSIVGHWSKGVPTLEALDISMDDLAGALATIVLGRPVVNRTGLTGRFDFSVEWTPDQPAPAPSGLAPDPVAPTPLQALRDQLGLKAESTRAPVPILVIDRVERPSEN
jgi:uncharacterized protein (TIGR03435 family)